MASQGDLGINSIISEFDELTYYNSTQIVLWGLSKFFKLYNRGFIYVYIFNSLFLYVRMSRNYYLATVGIDERDGVIVRDGSSIHVQGFVCPMCTVHGRPVPMRQLPQSCF